MTTVTVTAQSKIKLPPDGFPKQVTINDTTSACFTQRQVREMYADISYKDVLENKVTEQFQELSMYRVENDSLMVINERLVFVSEAGKAENKRLARKAKGNACKWGSIGTGVGSLIGFFTALIILL